MNSKRIAFAFLALSVTGCSGAALSSQTPGESTPTPIAASSQAPTVTPSPDPNAVETPVVETTPSPPAGPKRVAVGETAHVTSNGEPYLDITITQPSQHKTYGSGYSVDTPKKGNIYLQVYVTYKSLKDGASYNQFDWDVFADGVAVDDFTFVSSGPEPTLGSGELPKGRQAKGWLVYEVPIKGEVLLSYKGNMFLNDAPVFEVVIRKS